MWQRLQTLPRCTPDSELCSKGIIHKKHVQDSSFFFFFILPTDQWNFDFGKKNKIEILVFFFFCSTDRPNKNGLEKIREAKNQLCVA